MMDMMNILSGSGTETSWGVFAILMFLLFWIGAFLLAVYLVSTAKEDKYKTYLIAGLSLVIGTLFLSSLLTSSMLRGFLGSEMMKKDFLNVMQDKDVMKDFKAMMNSETVEDTE